MGRFLSKFSPSKMSKTAKQLVFKSPKLRETSEERFEREFLSYVVQTDNELIQEVDQILNDDPLKEVEKREREARKSYWEEERLGMIEREKERLSEISKGKRKAKIESDDEVQVQTAKIKLFGTEIKVEEGGSSKCVNQGIQRVYTLGELLDIEKQEGVLIGVSDANTDILAVSKCTAVKRDSLSVSFAVLEGEGDNYAGVHRSPSKTYTKLFSQYLKCCSPVACDDKEEIGPQSNVAYVTQESANTSGTFSFLSPLDEIQPYDPVEEWWTRRVCPSLQFSVTAIDPFMARHPVWYERYGETGQTPVEALYGGDNGHDTSAEGSFAVPKPF